VSFIQSRHPFPTVRTDGLYGWSASGSRFAAKTPRGWRAPAAASTDGVASNPLDSVYSAPGGSFFNPRKPWSTSLTRPPRTSSCVPSALLPEACGQASISPPSGSFRTSFTPICHDPSQARLPPGFLSATAFSLSLNPVKELFYNERLRRTPSGDAAFFVENFDGARAIRCIHTETLRAFAAYYAGQTAGEMGAGKLGDRIEIEGVNFTFTPGPNAWCHQGAGVSISLLPTCSPICAAQWLRAFKDASTHSPGFVNGVEAHHFVGASQEDVQLIALASGRVITWFNAPNGFLLSTGLAETTKYNEPEISAVRFIFHETGHLDEGAMKPSLDSLDAAIAELQQVRLQRPEPTQPRPLRVMPIPREIDVSEDLAERAKRLAVR